MGNRYLVFIALALLVTACGPQVNVEAERAALLERDKAWSETPPDLEKFVSFFAPDASFMAPEAPIATGTEAIRAFASKLLAIPGFSVRWEASKADVSGAGDMGYTVGTYELSVNDAAGNPVTTKGKYVTVWKKQADGQWKVVADIFNPDTPPPAPAAAPAPTTKD